jgi:hypothetical protein
LAIAFELEIQMKKIFKSVLDLESFELLKTISKDPNFNNFYLAGGTALALQIGHRKSIDLDFFTSKDFKSNLLANFPYKYTTNCLFDNPIEIISGNTKVMFFCFGFPLNKDFQIIEGVKFADPIDIGLMKLLALEGRTSRKDIIDLYFIHKEILSLEELLNIYDSFYPKEKYNNYKSMATVLNSEDYKKEPMPVMLRDFDWDEGLSTVNKEIIKFSKKKLNL